MSHIDPLGGIWLSVRYVLLTLWTKSIRAVMTGTAFTEGLPTPSTDYKGTTAVFTTRTLTSSDTLFGLWVHSFAS
jgi:hypothetical protein